MSSSRRQNVENEPKEGPQEAPIALKPRIFRGFRGSRTMVCEAPEMRNHMFYVVLA